jgi:hypothetical protein
MTGTQKRGAGAAAIVAAVALLAAVLPAAAAPARSAPTAGTSVYDPACGGVETARPTKKVNPGGRPPLAIGDSTMLLALPNLSHEGYRVDAHGCRQIEEGLGVIRDARRHGRLPHLVVIALGADASVSMGDLNRAFHLVGPKRVLGLVTPRELGGGSGSDADHVRAAAKRHRKRAVLLDWVAYSRGHPSWFQPDGLHLTFSGAEAFARLLRQALPYAKAGAFPQR